MSSHIDVIEANDDWVLGARGRLVVSVWRTGVTLDRVNKIDATIRALVPRCGKAGYGSVTVLEPSVSLRMPDDARDASTQLQRRWDEHMRCSGYLVEGSGFLPAAVRTMTAGMALFTKSNAPIKVFPDALSLSEFVAPHVALDAREVARTLHELRSAGYDRRPLAHSR